MLCEVITCTKGKSNLHKHGINQNENLYEYHLYEFLSFIKNNDCTKVMVL